MEDTNKEKELKFVLDGKELQLKEFKYKNDTVKQIKFIRKYTNFEKDYVGEDLYNQFYESVHKLKLIKDLTEEFNKEDAELQIQSLNQKLNDEYFNDVNSKTYYEFMQLRSEAVGLFLFDNEENAKILCELHFKNADEINHNPTDEKFLEYHSFILQLFNYFFFGKKNLKLI